MLFSFLHTLDDSLPIAFCIYTHPYTNTHTQIYIHCPLKARQTGVQPRSSHTKDSKNGTWCLHAQLYKVWIKGKRTNPRKRVAFSSTPWCYNYWKGNLLVALDNNQTTYIHIYIYIYIYIYTHTYTHMHTHPIAIMVRVFANGPGDWGSISGQVIPKTQKMVLDASLLNTQHYKVWITWYFWQIILI